MPAFNQLAMQSTVTAGDQLPIYSPNNGDTRRISIGALLDFFRATFAAPTMATYPITPGTGFNLAVPSTSSQQIWMLIQPVGTLANGTITLPLNSQIPDGAEVLVTTTQQITAFAVGLNGALAARGAPSTLAADDFFRLRFVQPLNTWYAIG